MSDQIITNLNTRMLSTINNLKHSLSGLRTGRASASLLEPIRVEIYDNVLPLNQVGTVSVPEARMLSVQVWDKSMVKNVEKAILESGLGLNPMTDGQIIRIPIPNLNEERRKELAKKAYEYSENAKIATRNIRRDGIDEFKKLEKDKKLSEDDLKNKMDEVQKLTDKYIKKIDEVTLDKSKEIMEI